MNRRAQGGLSRSIRVSHQAGFACLVQRGVASVSFVRGASPLLAPGWLSYLSRTAWRDGCQREPLRMSNRG